MASASEIVLSTLSVYIWNTAPMHELVSLVKCLSPATTIVLGGPEIVSDVMRTVRKAARKAR